MNYDFSTDPSRHSFLQVDPESHFPLQNLPYGVFRPNSGGGARCGVAIGDWVVDLAALERRNLVPSVASEPVFETDSLNRFAALGKAAWRQVRNALSQLLDAEDATIRDRPDLRDEFFYRQRDIQMLLPMAIGDYTDFYSSKEHATNVGIMFRGPDNALQPNWLHLPVGYHGRSSSVVISGTPIHRPSGQQMPPASEVPDFGASQAVDFELEMGFFTGPGTELGESVTTARAEEHIFGLVLVNDWSARDIQRWEYVPLGPFLGKNFATSISPWVVTLDALEPFRCDSPPQAPEPLAYLKTNTSSAFDIQLEVAITTAQLSEPFVVSRSNFRYLYWSMHQQLAHHTSNGCNTRPGDLMASGTISGSAPNSWGSLLELAWKGERPLRLPNGETRTMLQDGDAISMRGWAQGDGYRVGFGEVTGAIHS